MTDAVASNAPLVLFHSSCADGFTAAVGWRWLREQGAEAELHAAHYGEPAA